MSKSVLKTGFSGHRWPESEGDETLRD